MDLTNIFHSLFGGGKQQITSPLASDQTPTYNTDYSKGMPGTQGLSPATAHMMYQLSQDPAANQYHPNNEPYRAPQAPVQAPAHAVQQYNQAPQVSPEMTKLTSMIASGFNRYGAPQMAQYAPYFAQAGQGLPDPLMAAVLAIRETSGGKRMSSKNNVLNIGPGIDYPDIPTNLVGGNGKKGFVGGVIGSGIYGDYMKSHNLTDFFKHYSPEGDSNPPIAKQIQDYNTYRNYFLE